MCVSEGSFQKSVCKEVWQYRFLCLSACETAANTFVKALLIFTEPPSSSAVNTHTHTDR